MARGPCAVDLHAFQGSFLMTKSAVLRKPQDYSPFAYLYPRLQVVGVYITLR